MASIIFYGAGRNAHEHFNDWKAQGLIPICFSDLDISKHYTAYMGLDVLPLVAAIKKYPDYELYLTQIPSSLYEIRSFLISIGIPEERIKFCMDPEASGIVHDTNTLYPKLYPIYQAMQDELSKKWFWGRLEYTLSHSLAGIYKAMVSKEHLQWVSQKQTYAMLRHGLPALWELLAENYPVQKHDIYLLIFPEKWNEFDWVVERFLDALPELGIKIKACVIPAGSQYSETYRNIPCVCDKDFPALINENTRIIIGFPGWCLQTKQVAAQYKPYKEILFPIADTGHPQYIEPDIFPPHENEIFVDVGVFDLQNSIDFSQWAKKGFAQIYAFEPDPQCYHNSMDRLKKMDPDFQNKTQLVQLGLSDTIGKLEFPAVYKGSGNYGDGGMISVDVITMDAYLEGKPVTLVKMDVEGAEMSVLRGMKETITRHKPRLAVCVYHKHQDILEITSYLLSLVPEYKFYLRHYNSNETETVLFCTI